MSGISSRPTYDECFVTQHSASNVLQSDYSFFLNFNINPSVENKGDISSNTLIANENAEISFTPDNFGKLIDIDNVLKGLGTNVNLCDNNTNTLKNVIAVNPRLSDRDIIPTNLHH